MKRVLLILMGLALLPVLAWGQEMPFTAIQKQQRQGTVYGSYNVPASATGNLVIYSNINETDLTDTTLSIILRLEVYDGLTWQPVGGVGWYGGPRPDPGGRPDPPYWGPSMAVPIGQFAGKTIRCEITVPVRMSIGAVIDVLP